MAKSQKAAPEVASLNPADFLAGGLKSDFRVRFDKVVYCPWDYNGTVDPPALGVRVEGTELDVDSGEPLEDAKPYVEYWSAGDLDAWAPSEDGRTPAENDEGGVGEGPYAIKVGKRSQLNNNTNFAHLMRSIIEAGAASKKFLADEHLTSSLDCLETLDVHIDRVPQQKRSGMLDTKKKKDEDDDDEDEAPKKGASKSGTKDIPVVTKVYGYGAKASKKAKAKAEVAQPTKKAKVAEPEDDEDDDEDSDVDPIDQKLYDIITESLGETGKVKRAKLANIVLTAASKDKDKSKMIKRLNEDDFYAAGPWNYDEDTGVLTPKEDEDDD